jgi:hypothetical protein
MEEVFDDEILSKSMWETYNVMKTDNFKFEGYSTDDINMMINHILPYFGKIEEYEICAELKKYRRTNYSMEEILKEFGEIGAPSMYEITKLVYESKYGSDENSLLK